ncbi:F-box/FBD/LRR-repeat protein At1g16930-like [Abrus precatorius]|uniref:F-box/FBD/LRR-repeat protein At1g16930-like n=1 Tax=Abrus precatorius TaxID=3816 RepID=A0A8B8MME6_ABRPR|nr:F-box/FBD/LRR-repeat protein At1g16930-like [Abrus precatorius]
MAFMTTKESVQTCVLSKRWKELWKSLPTLTLSNTHFRKNSLFKKFIHKVLLHRDNSSALRNFSIEHKGFVHCRIFGNLIAYAVSHDVEQFKFEAGICCYARNVVFVNSLCPCYTLKYLNLSFRGTKGAIIFPETLDLPELIDCRLKDIAFCSSDSGCAKPFLGCNKLSTLVIDNCTIYDAEICCMFSDKLFNLTVWYNRLTYDPDKQRSTPNLSSFAFVGRLITSNSNHQPFEYNLGLLEDANVEDFCWEISLDIAETLKSWLNRFGTVSSSRHCSQTSKVLCSSFW